MTKIQDKIIDENHFRIRIDADKHSFPTHKKGGSDALNEIKKQLGAEFGIDNVSAHPHHDKSHFKIKVRREDIPIIKQIISNTNGLELTNRTFQFQGESIKSESVIKVLLGLGDKVEALTERNDDLIYQRDKVFEDYANNESKLIDLGADYTRVEQQRDEARAAANNPPRRQIIIEPKNKDEIPRLRREVSSLEETIKNTKKLDKNFIKYFEYDEKYDNAANEATALYKRAGIEIQIRDVKYLSSTEILNQNTNFGSRRNLAKSKNSLENKIRDIGNFNRDEQETEMGDAGRINEYGEEIISSYTLGELITAEEIPDLFTLGTDEYLPTKERTAQLKSVFGRKAKEINKRLTRHFTALRKLNEKDEHFDDIKEQIQYLDRVQKAVRVHENMIKYRSERDRFKSRIENG